MTKDTFLNAWSRELSIESALSTWDAKRFLDEFYSAVVGLEKSYGEYDGQRFPIGTKLTSLENGELIIAPKGTPDDEIVATVKADD